MEPRAAATRFQPSRRAAEVSAIPARRSGWKRRGRMASHGEGRESGAGFAGLGARVACDVGFVGWLEGSLARSGSVSLAVEVVALDLAAEHEQFVRVPLSQFGRDCAKSV